MAKRFRPRAVPITLTDEIGTKIEAASRMAREGRVDEAVETLSQLLLRYPTRTDILLNMGRILMEADRLQEAVDTLTVLKVHLPSNLEVQRALGMVLSRMRRYAAAEAALLQAEQLDPNDVGTLTALSQLYDQTDREALASDAALRALSLRPDDLDITSFAVGQLCRASRNEEASAVLAAAPPIVADSPEIRFLEAMLMPVIPSGMGEIVERREHLLQVLRSLREGGKRFRDPDQRLQVTNFYLGYHGLKDRALIQETADTVLTLAPALGYVSPRLDRRTVSGRRLRIGFLSANLRVHSVGRVLNRFLKELDRDRFEVLLFELPGKFQGGQEIARGFADRTVFLKSDHDSARRSVEAESPDVLMFTDFVMDPLSDSLAYSRLAPVQCSTWGHPGTSGRPSLDYWISCRDWEPPGNEKLYTEKLVRFTQPPMIATRLERPDPIASRAELGIPEGRLYGCPQSLYKLHPEYDAYLGEILRRDPGGHVVLIGGLQTRWVEAFKQRFARGFEDVLHRLVFLKNLSTSNYLSLLWHCDVSLDPIHFGGANTSMEAFTMGVPVIVQPGTQLRNRQTLSFYRMMDLYDLIVESREQYVELALQVARDSEYRAELAKVVRDRCHVLFDTVQVTRELETFFESAAREAIG